MGDKITVQQLIATTAETTAREFVKQLQGSASTGDDFYRATEALLRAYPRLRRLKENYSFYPADRSHDVIVSAPRGTMLDKVDAGELIVEARKRSFLRSMERYAELEAVIELFQNRDEFLVIRLLYFNEDIQGNDRGDGAKPYTWEDVAEALEDVGLSRSVSALRRWRSAIVKEMTVVLFGVEGALSVERGGVNLKNVANPDRRFNVT